MLAPPTSYRCAMPGESNRRWWLDLHGMPPGMARRRDGREAIYRDRWPGDGWQGVLRGGASFLTPVAAVLILSDQPEFRYRTAAVVLIVITYLTLLAFVLSTRRRGRP